MHVTAGRPCADGRIPAGDRFSRQGGLCGAARLCLVYRNIGRARNEGAPNINREAA
jgi:hypothetical protein